MYASKAPQIKTDKARLRSVHIVSSDIGGLTAIEPRHIEQS